MSNAYYYRGVTIEIDGSIPRVTIEGRPLPTDKLTGLLRFEDPPAVQIQKLRTHAQSIIKQSPEFTHRQKISEAHYDILKQGVAEWNSWRRNNFEIRPLLYDRNLTETAIGFRLDQIDFSNAVLIKADLRSQSLIGANFHEANLGAAKLHGANLDHANFCRSDLYETEMPGAKLSNANLQGTQLAKTNLKRAKLVGCKVYGISAWDLRLDGAEQRDLVIRYAYRLPGSGTGCYEEGQVTVDDLQLAQFIYLLLNNANIGKAIDAISSKGVLILGRFTDERKHILDQLRDALRRLPDGFVPVVFDFTKPTKRDFTETIKMLAGMSRFIIADITNPRSAPLELQAFVPDYMVPLVPIIEQGQESFAMFQDLWNKYRWVLDPLSYKSVEQLRQCLKKEIVEPALKKSDELRARTKQMSVKPMASG